MTRDEAITLILNRMTRSNDTELRTALELEIRLAQDMLEKLPTLPSFLFSEFPGSTLTVGADIVVFVPASGPYSFLRESSEGDGGLWRINNTSFNTSTEAVRLIKGDYDDLVDRFPQDSPGTPTHYALSGSLFRLRPVHDQIYNFALLAYARDFILTANVENGWLQHYPELLIARTGMLAAKYDSDKDIFEMFKSDYNEALMEMVVVEEAKRQAGRDAHMGEEDA